MKYKFALLLAIIFLLISLWWWSTYPAFVPASTAKHQEMKSILAATPPMPLAYKIPIKGKYQGSNDPRWDWWRAMGESDADFEWKMPIDFWGKAVDQDGKPMPGVKVRYGWNGMDGSNERFGETDGDGLFSITGIKGKLLDVRLAKEGYHAVNGAYGSFEYAAFFEPSYHEPDAKNPVVFRFVKKQEAEPLIQKEQKLGFPQTGSVAVLKLDETTSIEIRLIANGMQPDEPWSIRLTANSTAVQETTDEFPVVAPVGGYQASVLVDRKSPKPFGWSSLYKGGAFYVKTAKAYGLMKIEMIPGNGYARVATYMNPSGSRNLEYDPKKKIKAP